MDDMSRDVTNMKTSGVSSADGARLVVTSTDQVQETATTLHSEHSATQRTMTNMGNQSPVGRFAMSERNEDDRNVFSNSSSKMDGKNKLILETFPHEARAPPQLLPEVNMDNKKRFATTSSKEDNTPKDLVNHPNEPNPKSSQKMPGAYREGHRDERQRSLPHMTSDDNPHVSHDDNFLLEAQIVDLPDIVQGVAVTNESSPITIDTNVVTTRGRYKWILIGVLVVLIVTIVTSVVFVTKKDSPLTFVTIAPSLTPSFSPTASPWKQLGSSLFGTAPYDWFGYSIALSRAGTTLACGAPLANDNTNEDSGSVSVFVFLPGDSSQSRITSWIQYGTTIMGREQQDRFGFSVALSSDGSTLAASGDADPSGNTSGVNAGYVRVYRYSSDWEQVGEDFEGENANDFFGHSVALSDDGSTVAIGAPGNNGTGIVQVFQFNGTDSQWHLLGTSIRGVAKGDNFGFNVALSDNGLTLAAGANTYDGLGFEVGQVRVFRYDGVGWEQVGQSLDGVKTPDHFGETVALSSNGDVVAAGAPMNSDNGDSAGHVRVFRLTGDQWELIGNRTVGEKPGDRFGISLDLSSDGLTFAAGSDWNDENGVQAGITQVYTFIENDWQIVGQNLIGDSAGDQFGYSVALSGDGTIVANGAFFYDISASSENSGLVRISTRRDA